VVNRVLMPYMMEALLAGEDGVPMPLIDDAAKRFGMPMGPVELADTVGLDVALHVAKILGAAYGIPVPDRLVEMVEKKRLGRKTGRGFYDWKDGKAVKPAVKDAKAPQDLADRLILPMVNEAVAVWRDGVVRISTCSMPGSSSAPALRRSAAGRSISRGRAASPTWSRPSSGSRTATASASHRIQAGRISLPELSAGRRSAPCLRFV
jgi:hypothetical protein